MIEAVRAPPDTQVMPKPMPRTTQTVTITAVLADTARSGADAPSSTRPAASVQRWPYLVTSRAVTSSPATAAKVSALVASPAAPSPAPAALANRGTTDSSR